MPSLSDLPALPHDLPPTKSGRARSMDFIRGARRAGLVCDAVAVIKEERRPDEPYGIQEFPANGGRGFHVRKPFTAGAYTVFVGRVAESCDCAAGCYGKVRRCRHLEAVVAAIGNGWL